MMSIFNFFGSVLGYLLWFLYTVFKNYGIAIILFTTVSYTHLTLPTNSRV